MKLRINKNAIEILNECKEIVWPEIIKYLKSPKFPSNFDISDKYKYLEKFHWKLSNEYPLRKGKYIRPTLLLLTCAAMHGKKNLAIKTAAAMQLSEEWILIHDDIEDGSLLRRGKKTLHEMYNTELAINAGDTLQTVMWKVLFDNFPILGIKKTEKIINEFYTMIIRTEIGQTVEIKWFTDNKLDFTDEDWYFIGYSKSGYYSIGGPIRLGAIIADATPRQLDLLSEFGLELGNCWQLVDDILDITSDFEGRKQLGNDIYEGKRTVILGHLLRSVNLEDKEKLYTVIRKKREEKAQSEVEWVIKKMHNYGSIDYARKLAEIHKNKCEKIFKENLNFLEKEPERSEMQNLIRFILERKY